MENVFRDLRFGYRNLLRNPGFTAAAVVSLAIGIGANTAIFSFINTILLKPLPVAEPRSLALFGEGNGRGVSAGPPNGATLLWIDSKEKVPPADPTLANAGPASGSPDSPKDIWSLERVTDPAKVAGMVLALELDGKRLISIPVEGDKLAADKATVDPTLVLKPAP